jgi:hypothetical protein
MRPLELALAALIALSLAGCNARTVSSDAPQAPATEPAASQPAAPAPAAASPPAAQDLPLPVAPRADTAKIPGLADDGTRLDAANPSRSCNTDSDCAVKDVGNCCGYFPMCVNKDARTDPAAVRAQCDKDGMASICGFREVSGCQCVDNQCQSLTDGAVDR